TILPAKLEIDFAYCQKVEFLSDLKLLFLTFSRLAGPSRESFSHPQTIKHLVTARPIDTPASEITVGPPRESARGTHLTGLRTFGRGTGGSHRLFIPRQCRRCFPRPQWRSAGGILRFFGYSNFSWMVNDSSMRITYYGQACTLTEAGGLKILTDPWLTEGAYCGTWFHTHLLEDAGVTPESFPKDVHYLFLSHEHQDHLDPAALKHFPKNIPVLICRFATPKF